MPTIDPFNFQPLGPFNDLTAYFLLTWIRAQYHGDAGNAEYDNEVKRIAGATEFRVFPHEEIADPLTGRFFFPRTDLMTLPDGRQCVLVRGTTRTPDELIAEATGSNLVTDPLYQGLVSSYFRTVAQQTYNRLPVMAPGWLVVGHSLGGAIASMVGIHGAAKYFTVGQPREGNGIYADSRPSAFKLRLTTQTDPVPRIPFSSGGYQDYLDIEPPSFLVSARYRHWGIRHHLWPDGSMTLPPGQETPQGEDALGFASDALADGFLIHLAPTYVFRCRQRLPFIFPYGKIDADFPMIADLDNLNLALNAADNITWDIPGRPKFARPPFVGNKPIPPGVLPNTDPYQFLCE